MGSQAAADNRTLLVLGAGPGIGRSVTTLFASKRYNKVALVARRAEQLRAEKEAVESAVPGVWVETYAVDLTNTDALTAVLDQADSALGKPEAVFYNAARVVPSELFVHPVEDIEYDFKITVSALYNVAQRYIPHLVKLSQADPSARPAFIVTSSALPFNPIPQLFALSLTKAAQRNLVQSLHMTYASQGVHIGVVNVQGGPVSADHEVWNPANIASKAWNWFETASTGGKPSFEVAI